MNFEHIALEFRLRIAYWGGNTDRDTK